MMWDAAARQVRSARRQDPHGHAAREPALERQRRAVDHRRHHRRRRMEGPSRRAHVISSAPIRELVGSIHPQPACKAAADKLRYRDFLTVALIVDKPDLFPDNWIYIHEPSVKVGRIQNFRSWSPEMVPDEQARLPRPGIFLLRGRRAVDRLRRGADRARQEGAGHIGLAAEDEVKDGCVVRQKKAYPVYDEGYKAERRDDPHRAGREVPDAASRRPQRHAQVQQPGPRHDDGHADRQEHHAGATVYDVWNVNEDAEYHEAGDAGAAGGARQRAPGADARGVRGKVRCPREARTNYSISVLSGATGLGAARAAAFALHPGRHAGPQTGFSHLSAAGRLRLRPSLRPSWLCRWSRAQLRSVAALRVRRRRNGKSEPRLLTNLLASGLVGAVITTAVIALATDVGVSTALCRRSGGIISFAVVLAVRRSVVLAARELAPASACADLARPGCSPGLSMFAASCRHRHGLLNLARGGRRLAPRTAQSSAPGAIAWCAPNRCTILP